MRKPMVVLLLVALLGALFAAAPASAQAPAPTTRFNNKFANITPPAQFDLVELVLDFEPGAFFPEHTHGGQTFVTVLEGQLTHRAGGVETVLTAGQSASETPGEFSSHGNNSTTARTRILVSILLPPGAAVTTVKPGAQIPSPGPTVVMQGTTPATGGGLVDIYQIVQDYAVGACTSVHKHGGLGLVLVLAGTFTLTDEGVSKTYTAGQQFFEPAGRVHQNCNTGATPGAIAATFVVPAGAALTTVVSATPVPATPRPPSTGNGRNAGRDGSDAVVLVALALAILGSGALVLRRVR